MAKNILVLGGAGYIGSHAALILNEKGYNPVIYDNLSRGHKELASGHDLVIGDIADGQLLKRILSEKKIDTVMHFAASSLVEESTKDPLLYYRNNVQNTIILLSAMRETGVNRIIFSSSAAVYGAVSDVPIKEGHPVDPINTYGRTKLMIEQMLEDMSRAHGLQYVSLRYFNAAGAHENGKIGEWHEPETHLIPLILDAALGEREDIKIFGTDYNTPDGTCIRDYVHVTDLIGAHILAVDFLEKGNRSGVFNLGNGKGYSIKEVIDTVREVCGLEIPVHESSRREGDPPELVASSDKAKEIMGWEPRYNDINVIIKSAWKWHRYLIKNIKKK